MICPLGVNIRIGKITDDIRAQRKEYFENHNTFEDDICRENCLDICIFYNNKWRDYHENI